MSDVWTPPQAPLQDASLLGNEQAAEIRRRYLNHEAGIKSAGRIYYLIAVLLILSGIIGLTVASGSRLSGGIVVSALFFVMATALIIVGTGLRKLEPWAKIPSGVLSAIGLLWIPVGTLINAYILYLVFSQKGIMVFSDEYRLVVASTPDIKYRTSPIVWAVLVLIVVAIALPFILSATRG
jgi:hypothetical protein